MTQRNKFNSKAGPFLALIWKRSRCVKTAHLDKAEDEHSRNSERLGRNEDCDGGAQMK